MYLTCLLSTSTKTVPAPRGQGLCFVHSWAQQCLDQCLPQSRCSTCLLSEWMKKEHSILIGISQFSSVQSLSRVQLFATPWIAAHQASLSITNSQSSLRLTSIESVMPSSYLILCLPFSCCLQSFQASGSFPRSQLFASDGLSTVASAPALLMNIQGWLPLGLTSLISLQSKGFSRVFSSTTIQKQQFFGAQPSLWSNCHICTWLLERPWFWLYGFLLAKWLLCFLIYCLGLSWLFLQRARIF